MAQGRTSAGIGIDLGSTTVRVALYDFEDNTLIQCVVEPVPYYFNPESTSWKYTQSSKEILNAIEVCLRKLHSTKYDIKSCGVGATCSMALFTKHQNTLLPWNIDCRDRNVIFWMDSTAMDEAQQVNQLSKPEVRNHMGGSFVPEMGIPKLKHLINFMQERHIELELKVFDLHRYIAWYLAKKFNWSYDHICNVPNLNGIGHDGELAGWAPEFYREVLHLPPKITIGPQTVKVPSNSNILKVTSCIDCYSNWFALLSQNLQNSIFIVGGTSTCYLYASNIVNHNIPGVWGPFSNILDHSDHFSVYEAGQSCTGKLIEHLFKSHPASSQTSPAEWPQLFDKIEEYIREIESNDKCSIHLATKHMFFYGDLEGNRTPYADPEMSGMFIGETTDTSFKNLVYKYICILEFIAFQVKHMITLFGELKPSTQISEIKFCGSQAKNQRLLNLISLLNEDVIIRMPTMDVSLMGAYGSFLMGKASSVDKSVIEIANNNTIDYVPRIQDGELLSSLFNTKYEIYLDMANQQKDYRNRVNKSIGQYLNVN